MKMALYRSSSPTSLIGTRGWYVFREYAPFKHQNEYTPFHSLATYIVSYSNMA